MNMEYKKSPPFTKVKQWVDEYGSSGNEDKKAVHDFMMIEPNEAVASLRSELLAILQGNYSEKVLDVVVKPKRRDRHGSYHEWARLMLLWMSSARG